MCLYWIDVQSHIHVYNILNLPNLNWFKQTSNVGQWKIYLNSTLWAVALVKVNFVFIYCIFYYDWSIFIQCIFWNMLIWWSRNMNFEILYNIVKVFTVVTFYQFNSSLLNTNITFFFKKKILKNILNDSVY